MLNQQDRQVVFAGKSSKQDKYHVVKQFKLIGYHNLSIQWNFKKKSKQDTAAPNENAADADGAAVG